jgi:glycosyltransferase involved in cell wall biosynthesis
VPSHRAKPPRPRRGAHPARGPRRLRRLEAVPRVSCIVTAYNYGGYVAEAVESALAQDYPAHRLQIIVVDDGSTDDTPDVLARYADRVQVIRQDNAGVNAATTTGLQAATGQLLTFLDGDDAWPRDRVRLLVAALRRNPQAGIAYGDQEVVDAAGTTVADSLREYGGVPAYSGPAFGHLTVSNFISGGSMMVRAELRDLFSPIPEHGGYQDWWIASQAARAAEVVSVDDVVNRYRLHGANANLGATGERRAVLCETEIPFRRWMLRNLEPSVGFGHIRDAIRAFDANLGILLGLRSAPPAQLLGIGEEDRRRAIACIEEASTALERGTVGAALLRLAAAVGHDPLWDEPRSLIDQLGPVLRDMLQARAAA